MLKTEGRKAYERHAADLRTLKPEVLPKMRIWRAFCQGVTGFSGSHAARLILRNDDDPSEKPSKREDVLKMNADSDAANNGDDAGGVEEI